jgi:prophage DNA circulation protein
MASIADIHTPWRDNLRQASFRGVPFHVEVGAKSSGRRIVVHEYPKRDLPYAEDMGRRAKRFTITGYFIQYPNDQAALDDSSAASLLLRRDYRLARDELIRALETEGPGALVHPTLQEAYGDLMVVAEGYAASESRERGGFCVVDMQFVEVGSPGNDEPLRDTQGPVDQLGSALGGVAAVTLDTTLQSRSDAIST